ncbi:DUF6702 family protein [Zunongwangia atlantica]|uniref:Peptidase E n=1 Tax=Zunongwangia atlantica 22II14-10F7 TaxID=1185767 RepID=A0A1Y1T458_9FLAO|nr:DUF6702 family protein [Zunongwangia atlantica]ORL45827.1 hypothetical protein IIF7_09250 [Zunongwangia atlantica 22II14-10F7]
MKKAVLLIFVVFACISFKAIPHKFYLSVTEIEYKKDKKDLQIISKVFIDDFQNVLEQRYGESITLSKETETGPVKELIQKYLKSKLHIYADGKEVALKYLGKKYDKDQLVLFIEGENLEPFKEISITNAILIDLFEDQKNVVNVKVNNEIKSLMLRKDAETDVLNFGI